jgi:hypothetical protein
MEYSMRAYRIEKKVSQHGKIQLESLPFAEGEVVEIIVLAREQKESAEAERSSLAGSVIHYVNPTEPVAQDEWSALQ